MSREKTGLGTGEKPTPPSVFEYIDLGVLTNEPPNSDIPDDKVAVYMRKKGGEMRMFYKPWNGDEQEVPMDAGSGTGGFSALKKDETSTFSESGVSISHTDTVLNSNDNVALGTTLSDGTTASRASDTGSSSPSVPSGVMVNPNVDLAGLDATLSSNTSGVTQAELFKDSDGTVIDTDSPSSGSVSFEGSLSSGTDYVVTVDAGGSSYSAGWSGDSSPPYTSSDVDIPDGYYDSSSDGTCYSINSVTAVISSGATSGDALVSWDSIADDITEWGFIEFTKSEDGETVTVDIEDGSGNVIASDVHQYFPLAPESTATDLKLRINLSRSSTSNDPTCGYLARHYRTER